MQRAERAGGHGHRLPTHHVRAAAPAGPVEGGGVLPPLFAHHPGHLTGEPHGRLRSHLEDERARRLQSGREAGRENLHDAALAGILSGEGHLEPVQGRVSRLLRADDRQLGRALRGEWERREGHKRERGDQCAKSVYHSILQEPVSASSELYGFLREMKRIALATSAMLPTLNDDDRLLVPALAELGVAAVPAVWVAPEVRWDEFRGG